MKIVLTKNLHANIEADCLPILTTESHRLTNPATQFECSFAYGVRAWSEQMVLTMSREWIFR